MLRSNEAREVADTYEALMKEEVLPDIPLYDGEDRSMQGRLQHVWIVMGDNFFNNVAFKEVNEDWGVMLSTVVADQEHKSATGNPLGIVDACTRTRKDMLRRLGIAHRRSERTPFRWTTALKDVIDTYNDRKGHRGLPPNRTPNDMYKDRHVLATVYFAKGDRNRAIRGDPSGSGLLPIGTKVRLVEKRASKVQKGPALRLSEKVYTITGYAKGGNRYELDQGSRKPRLNDVVKVSSAAVDFNPDTNVVGRQNTTLRREVGVARDAPAPPPAARPNTRGRRAATAATTTVATQKQMRSQKKQRRRLDNFDSDED